MNLLQVLRLRFVAKETSFDSLKVGKIVCDTLIGSSRAVEEIELLLVTSSTRFAPVLFRFNEASWVELFLLKLLKTR